MLKHFSITHKSPISIPFNRLFRPHSLSTSFHYQSYHYFSLKRDNPEQKEHVIITEEELINAQLLKKQNFRERNKLTFGFFASGIGCSLLGYFFSFYGFDHIKDFRRLQQFFMEQAFSISVDQRKQDSN